MRFLVYQDTVEGLFAQVLDAAQYILQPPGVIERVYHNIIRRYNVSNELGGRHIEPLLLWISINQNLSTVEKNSLVSLCTNSYC